GNHGVELLADLEALRALLVAVAAKVAALDEAGRSILADLHVKACILDGPDRNGNRLALLDTGRGSAAGSGALAAAALEFFMPRLMRSFSTSSSRTWAFTVSP